MDNLVFLWEGPAQAGLAEFLSVVSWNKWFKLKAWTCTSLQKREQKGCKIEKVFVNYSPNDFIFLPTSPQGNIFHQLIFCLNCFCFSAKRSQPSWAAVGRAGLTLTDALYGCCQMWPRQISRGLGFSRCHTFWNEHMIPVISKSELLVFYTEGGKERN